MLYEDSDGLILAHWPCGGKKRGDSTGKFNPGLRWHRWFRRTNRATRRHMDRSAVGGSGRAARSTHLDDKGLPGMDEGPSLAKRPGGIFLVDAIAPVVRGQAKCLCST